MPTNYLHYQSLQRYEANLQQQDKVADRIDLLDQLLTGYVYVDHEKSSLFLAEYEQLLHHFSDDQQLRFQYFHHLGILANQKLDFSASQAAFKTALDLEKTAATAADWAALYVNYLGTLINLQAFEEAYQYISLTHKMLQHKPQPTQEMHLFGREGYWHLHLNNKSEALRLLLEADKRFDELESSSMNLRDYAMWANVRSGIGHVHYENEDFEKGVQMHESALNICLGQRINTRNAWHYAEIGRGYLALGQLDKAEYFSATAIHAAGLKDSTAKVSAWANLGQCAFQKNDYKQALERYADAEREYKQRESANAHNLFTIELWRAQLYRETGHSKMQEQHLLKAMQWAESSANPKQIGQICLRLSEYYENEGRIEEAYQFAKLHIEFQQAFHRSASDAAMLELEVKYETERKRRAIEQQQRHALKLQMKALRAQINPHFFSNALNAIQHFINEGGADKASMYLAKFAQYMRDCLYYSEKEFITLEEEIDFIKDYLLLNQNLRMQGKLLEYRIHIDDEVEEDILLIPTMLIQPYVENALEHGIRSIQNGVIDIYFSMHSDQVLECIVRDNGVGRKQAALQRATMRKETGPHGTDITRDRLQLLHEQQLMMGIEQAVKTIDLIEGDTALGTQVNLHIPVFSIDSLPSF